MQTTNRQATTTVEMHQTAHQPAEQHAEQRVRGPQPIDAALLHLIGGGAGEGGPVDPQSPKGGW